MRHRVGRARLARVSDAPTTDGVGAELRALVALCAPLALMELSHSGIAAMNTAFAAPLGAVEQSGIGLGNVILFSVTVLGLGLVLGFDPLFAQAFGAGEERRAGHFAWQAAWMSLLASVPVMGALVAISFVLPHIGLDPGTADATARYTLARTPSVIPFLVGIAARGYLQARGSLRPILIGSAVSVVLNVPIARALILGSETFGFGGMGVAGAGWASTIAALVMTLVMLAGVGRPEGGHRLRWATLRRASRLGMPLSGQLFAEVGMFSLVTFLIGYFGPQALTGHHIALTLSSLTFQVTLAIGAAASVRVGRAIGRGDVPGTRRAGFTAIGLGLAFMGVSSAVFWAFPAPLAELLADEPGAVSAAIGLIAVAAAFQIVDGVQAVTAGVLRGAGDTTPVFYANVLGHYVLGLPIGLALTYGLGLGPVGLWWGLSAGLAVVAVALVWRFHRLSRRAIARS